ncbi:hypothetical protein [Corynebacterium guangdongense]|uniref:ABC-type multidrug transport system permease subunit n=1 Tax=Corynebacterium guangdongense TaxID=1783348 RepID=A0ABU2A248_9CORY|nr:hypothetical protein [Corynebacterium guangdongense]MDR7330183.1 ABC-type multidrug transport system permease subunit [Corynebacterium guangdongense]WJZ18741.1 hypothetical protein CGUA_10970 [Corynebacterium guangdongense]
MKLLIQILVELLIATVAAVGGILMISNYTGTAQILGVILLIVGLLVGVHLTLGAAFGRMRTPQDFGAGFRVPTGKPGRGRR